MHPHPPVLARNVVRRIVDTALNEDLASGDITTEACVDPGVVAFAYATAREELVVCGGVVFEEVFRQVDPTIEIAIERADGQVVGSGTRLWTVCGPARGILMGERVALNLVQRMSGTATLAHRFVRAVPVGLSAVIADTRKTTPGLRALERYAVRVGGAHNHRDNLGGSVLIKDNHIAVCGSIGDAIARARRSAPHCSKIEIEVDDLEQLDEALAAKADVVLLDNFSVEDVEAAVSKAAGRVTLEVSGGVTLDRVPALARAGANVISVGALTHSARAADIALEFGQSPDFAEEMPHETSRVSLRV